MFAGNPLDVVIMWKPRPRFIPGNVGDEVGDNTAITGHKGIRFQLAPIVEEHIEHPVFGIGNDRRTPLPQDVFVSAVDAEADGIGGIGPAVRILVVLPAAEAEGKT